MVESEKYIELRKIDSFSGEHVEILSLNHYHVGDYCNNYSPYTGSTCRLESHKDNGTYFKWYGHCCWCAL